MRTLKLYYLLLSSAFLILITNCEKREWNNPVVKTSPVSEISSNGAILGGSIASESGSVVIDRGVCYSTTHNPTTASNTISMGNGIGSFSKIVSGLFSNTRYYVRAYATNSARTVYGNEVYFTTKAAPGIPTLSTTTVTSITETTASSGGSITNNGGAMITARGVCWSKTTNPTATGSHTTEDIATGSFTSSISGLTANTTYYVRAYATNSAGTAYGNVESFTTSPPVFPTLSTTAVTSITETTASSGGNIISDGGQTVTERGVCWSTDPNPTINDDKTVDGSGTGSYSSSLSGLSPYTTYYIRAYATNSVGIGYGNEVSFTTSEPATNLTIGDSYQGGIVAYILQAGDPGYIEGETHGLIAAPNDQSAGAKWGCDGITISGADGTAIGTGNQNTNYIMAGCSTSGIAARLCGDLVLGGYSDWYLPSKDELNKLYLIKTVVGGFSNDYYWSSSEYYFYGPWYQHFYGGSQYGGGYKSATLYVRAIRAF